MYVNREALRNIPHRMDLLRLFSPNAMPPVAALHEISDVRTVQAPEPREVTIDLEYMSPYGGMVDGVIPTMVHKQ
jgi:hypothetical protein